MVFDVFLSFLAASFLLAIMPGPDNIYVLTESLTSGHKNGIAISIGLSSGVLIHTLAAATGLSIIIQKSAIAFSIIKYMGAAYLFFLAWKAAKEKTHRWENITGGCRADKNILQLVRKGFLMNLLNPKVSLFFIAFLPQFVVPSGMNITWQMIILGAVFMLQSLLVFCLLAMLSGKLSRYLNNFGFWNITRWGKVIVLSVLGMFLALSNK